MPNGATLIIIHSVNHCCQGAQSAKCIAQRVSADKGIWSLVLLKNEINEEIKALNLMILWHKSLNGSHLSPNGKILLAEH